MLLLSTDSLRGYGLYRIFKFAKEAKFDGIDLAINKHNFDTSDHEYLNELIKKNDLKIQTIQCPVPASAKSIQSTVELAKKVNCKIIIVQSPKIFNFKLTQWMKKEIPKLRKKENISIALENPPNTTILGFIPEHSLNNLNELKKFKHCCIDTSRIAQKKADLIRTYQKLKPYLVHIHLSNVYKSKYYYLPNEGILPIESFLTKLKQENYKGAISIKINPKFLEVGKDSKVLKKLKEIREFHDEYFKKK